MPITQQIGVSGVVMQEQNNQILIKIVLFTRIIWNQFKLGCEGEDCSSTYTRTGRMNCCKEKRETWVAKQNVVLWKYRGEKEETENFESGTKFHVRYKSLAILYF